MSRFGRLLCALGMAALAAAAGCGDDGPPPGPQAGEFTLTVVSAPPEAAAVLLRIIGPVTTVAPAGGQRVASAPLATPNVTRVVITGAVAGDLLRVSVPDVSLLSTYSVVVEQAAGQDVALLDPALFDLVLRR